VTLLPVRLEPLFVPRIWGARSLAPLFPEKSNMADPVGEAWMTGNDCRFASGPFIGKSLREIWPALTNEWSGSNTEGSQNFPLLVKFLFPEEKLSVQVHPDDEYARENEEQAGGVGKTEMWYAISAKPGASVMVNFKSGTSPAAFRQAVADGKAEDSLEVVPIVPGDVIYVPAGTVHTIGSGVVLCEIQQNSDVTYRVYDYDRRDTQGGFRPLHLEKAFAVMNFGESAAGKVDAVRVAMGGLQKTFYVACPYFAAEKWEFSVRLDAASSAQHFDLLIFLEGTGTIEAGGRAQSYAPGHVWLIPAHLGDYQIAPESRTALLRTYVPGDLDGISRQLTDLGVPEPARTRLVCM
jgi:mannose-6-phosphate isomerase